MCVPSLRVCSSVLCLRCAASQTLLLSSLDEEPETPVFCACYGPLYYGQDSPPSDSTMELVVQQHWKRTHADEQPFQHSAVETTVVPRDEDLLDSGSDVDDEDIDDWVGVASS